MSDEHARDPSATPERLAAFRRGDRVVLEDMFRAYAPYVHALVRRGLRTSRGSTVWAAHDVDDIVQEVFVRVFQTKARNAFDAQQTFAGFVSGFARLVTLEAVRQQNRTPLLDDDSWASQLEQQWAPHHPLPDSLVERRRQQAHLQAYLQQLTPDEQQFVLLRLEQGLPQRDVAERMQTTRHQVRVLEETVREGLRAFWAEVQGLATDDDSDDPQG